MSTRASRPRSAARRALGLALTAAVLASCGGGEPTISGKLRHLDDTGIAPFPIEEGWIVALPASEGDGARLAAKPEGELRHLAEEFEETAVLESGGAWEALGRGGRFTLPVEPGTWVVCWVDEGSDGTPSSTRGCTALALEVGARLAVTFGEGGVGVQTE